MASSPAASSAEASSTSANNDPSQHNPHRVQSVSVRPGFIDGHLAAIVRGQKHKIAGRARAL